MNEFRKDNSAGIAGFILGLVALLAYLLFAPLGMMLSPIALVLSLIGLNKAHSSKVFSALGLVISLVGCIPCILGCLAGLTVGSWLKSLT